MLEKKNQTVEDAQHAVVLGRALAHGVDNARLDGGHIMGPLAGCVGLYPRGARASSAEPPAPIHGRRADDSVLFMTFWPEMRN